MLLEIAAFSIEDALIASQVGADRIELCSNYSVGGITCCKKILELTRKKITIPIFAIIRPRGGNFCYSNEEFEMMKKNILLCKDLQYNGIVTGILNADKTIDKTRTKELVELAHPLPVTFHRAFDEVPQPQKALQEIIDCGCRRVLTSGQKKIAFEGKDLIRQLIAIANNALTIVVGGGVRSDHIKELKDYTQATEFHSAAITQHSKNIINATEINNLLLALKN